MEQRASTINNTANCISAVLLAWFQVVFAFQFLQEDTVSVSWSYQCFLIAVLRNGDAKQQNLTTLQVDKITRSSLTPSEQDEEEEEEGQVTPLPGSTVELDVLAWPPDEDTQGQVHVTVIPLEQVSVFLRRQHLARGNGILYEPEINCLKIVYSSRSFIHSFQFWPMYGSIEKRKRNIRKPLKPHVQNLLD